MHAKHYPFLAAALLMVGCQGQFPTASVNPSPSPGANPTPSPTPAPYQVIAPSQAFVGDVFTLEVRKLLEDGTTTALPTNVTVAWKAPTTVFPVASESDAVAGVLPATSSAPTGVFIDGMLYILGDPQRSGTLTVSAQVAGPTGSLATASIAIAPMPVGNAVRGGSTYAANCATCHGVAGEGILVPDDAASASMASGNPWLPAPGLNAAADHVAAEPTWSAAMLALAARADVDDEGVRLCAPMPNWMTKPGESGEKLTTQDFADMWAWLKTQH